MAKSSDEAAKIKSNMAARSCELDPKSEYEKWPKALLDPLCRSYMAHGTMIAGEIWKPLPKAFEAGEPSDFHSAISRTLPESIKVVYVRAIHYMGLWESINYIFNVWHTDNHGFKFSCDDANALLKLKSFLQNSISFCRDESYAQMMHQDNTGNWLTKKYFAALVPTHVCYRECVNGTPGLHICLPVITSHIWDCDMHVDPHQIVKGRDSDGTCAYDYSSAASHLLQVIKGSE